MRHVSHLHRYTYRARHDNECQQGQNKPVRGNIIIDFERQMNWHPFGVAACGETTFFRSTAVRLRATNCMRVGYCVLIGCQQTQPIASSSNSTEPCEHNTIERQLQQVGPSSLLLCGRHPRLMQNRNRLLRLQHCVDECGLTVFWSVHVEVWQRHNTQA